MRLLAIALLMSACGGGGDKPAPTPKKDAGSGLGGVAISLPLPPPLPTVPAGLPTPPEHDFVTPELAALGELLFFDARLSTSNATSCATCHAPTRGFAGDGRQQTDAKKPNLRRAPALVNLAWSTSFGWDGRYPTLAEHLPPHVRGQLGDELAATVTELARVPLYQAHFDRTGGATAEIATRALAAFVATRYAGSAPWDLIERSPDRPKDVDAGFTLFTTKAGCATCHTPPLYTNHAFHRLGVIATPDDGRGRVDPNQKGAFKTPTLRDAVKRGTYFHDASAASLDAAIDFHLGGGVGQGADPSIVDPAIAKPVALSPAERAQLGAFVRALSAN